MPVTSTGMTVKAERSLLRSPILDEPRRFQWFVGSYTGLSIGRVFKAPDRS